MGKGGKVPQSTLTTQGGLQSGLGGLAQNYGAAAQPAQNYWTQLLQGGQGAQNVVAPSAMNISQTAEGAQNSIQNFLPMGGERNLAMANLQNQKQGQIANLYANVQPMAANALTGLANLGSSIGNTAVGAGNSLLSLLGQQQQGKGSALGGIGSGVGTFLSAAPKLMAKI